MNWLELNNKLQNGGHINSGNISDEMKAISDMVEQSQFVCKPLPVLELSKNMGMTYNAMKPTVDGVIKALGEKYAAGTDK